MVTYAGWTLDDVMDLTLPQANMLFKQMGDMPSPAVVLAAFVASMKDKDGGETLPANVGEKVEGSGATFLEKLGIIDVGG